MHDGGLASLDAVIAHYAAAGMREGANPSLGRFSLERAESERLRAFLEALTDEHFVRDERFRAPRASDAKVPRSGIRGQRSVRIQLP